MRYSLGALHPKGMVAHFDGLWTDEHGNHLPLGLAEAAADGRMTSTLAFGVPEVVDSLAEIYGRLGEFHRSGVGTCWQSRPGLFESFCSIHTAEGHQRHHVCEVLRQNSTLLYDYNDCTVYSKAPKLLTMTSAWFAAPYLHGHRLGIISIFNGCVLRRCGSMRGVRWPLGAGNLFYSTNSSVSVLGNETLDDEICRKIDPREC